MKIEFNPEIFKTYPSLFTYKAREMCKSCKRYGFKANCPPNVHTIEYYKYLFPTYRNGILIVEKFDLVDGYDWKKLGIESSLKIHNQLLETRHELLNNGQFGIIYGAGSCKFCSDICSLPCKYPNKAVMPLEATGLDVVGLVNVINKEIDIKFPVKDFFWRIGMVLFDD